MNDSVLRGFCKKIIPIGSRNVRTCGVPVYYDLEGKYWEHMYNADGCYHPEGIGFLSPKQMKILIKSKIFLDWLAKNTMGNHITYGVGDDLARFLESEPFFVSKILKEADVEGKK